MPLSPLRPNRSRSLTLPVPLLRLYLIALAALVLLPAQARQSDPGASHFRGHVIRVEAGDRIVARLQTLNLTVQLHGVSCPTSPPEARERARAYTVARVLNTDVDVAVRGTAANQTVYGEVVLADGSSLNQELVGVGLATWARAYAPARSDLAALQDQARAAARGIWSDHTAANVPLPTPWPRSTPTPRPLPTRAAATPIPRPATPLASTAPAPTIAPPSSTPLAVRPRSFDLPPAGTPAGDPRLWLIALFAGLTLALTVASCAALGFSAGRLPFQIAIAALAAAAITLMLPLFSGAATGHSATRFGLIAILPPILFACGWAAVALPHREQMLRGATRITGGNVDSVRRGKLSADRELVRVSGHAAGPHRGAPLVSTVGAIPAIYLHEVTQIYQASEHSAGQPARNRRYTWRTIANDRRMADFLLAESGDLPQVVVEAERAEFHTGHIARFYNEVPVERWFARPYPGDTRTEITFIAHDAPIVVWGRARTVPTPTGEPQMYIGYDGARELLVVAEGDGSAVWTRRPLLGLLFTLVASCLAVILAISVASTPAPAGPASRHTFAIGQEAAILCFWIGAFSLVGLIRSARAAFAAEREFHRHLTPLEAALEPRRERVFALFSRDDALIEAARRAENAHNAGDRISAEWEIDERLQRFAGGGPMPLGATARPDDIRAELQRLQAAVTVAAVRYNEAFRTVAFLRLRFPTGLFLRARDPNGPAAYGND